MDKVLSTIPRVETMTTNIATKVSALMKTVEDYTNRSTVHGLGYTLDKNLFRVDRALWILICLVFASLAMHLTYEAYNHWQNNQVLITLKNTAKPVNQIDFPMVTICSSGLHMDLVHDVLEESFKQWYNDSSEHTQEDMARYMAEYFQIQNKSEIIMDIIDTMLAPKIEAAVAANSVRDNIIACSGEADRCEENTMATENIIRKKREVTSGSQCCTSMNVSSTASSQIVADMLGIYRIETGACNQGMYKVKTLPQAFGTYIQLRISSYFLGCLNYFLSYFGYHFNQCPLHRIGNLMNQSSLQLC